MLKQYLKDIAASVARFKELHHERYWMEEEQQWRWEHFKTPRRVVCAANRYGDYIVTGMRHYCVVMNMQIDSVGGLDVLHHYARTCDHDEAKNYEQGFIDQYGNFLDRSTAYIMAKENGQLLDGVGRPHTLFSEDVW